jgi:hypothetical protein
MQEIADFVYIVFCSGGPENESKEKIIEKDMHESYEKFEESAKKKL